MRRYKVAAGGASVTVEVHEATTEGGPLRLLVDGQERFIEASALGPQRYTWREGTRVVLAEIEPEKASTTTVGGPRKLQISVRGQAFAAEVSDAAAVEVPVVAPARPAGPAVLRAPMPGRVVKLLCRAGDEVKAGAGLVVVEAMKMENELKAPRDGRVSEVKVGEGAAVEAGQDLLVVS